MRRLALFFSLCLAAACGAQDIGNVGIRTVNATVANAAICTGSPQNFSTSNAALNAVGFRNIGQTSHLATATSNAATFQMEIDGIDNLGNVFRLSDLQVGIPTSAKGGLVTTASGYMPNIQISVTCSSGSTFSISYSGSYSPQPPNVAGALLVATDKLPFQTAPANTTASTTFQTPYGNSQGTIIFQYAAAGPSGSTVTAQCLSNSGSSLSLFTFSPGTGTAAQLFSVSGSTCPFVTLTYTSGGASATTYNLEYVFTNNSTSNASSGQNTSGPVQPPTTKNSENTSGANAALTVSIPGVSNQRVYLFAAAVRASAAATCSVTVKDGVGGTIIWSSDSAFVSTSTRTITWSSGLASSVGNGMDVVVSACGGTATSTLDLQESQL